MGPKAADASAIWRPGFSGIEVLHARFRRHRYSRHAHDATTVAVVDAGAAEFECAGRHHVAPRGSVFLISPGVVHTGVPGDPDGYRYRVLYLTDEAFTRLRPGQAPPRFAAADTVVRDPELYLRLDAAHRLLAGPAAPAAQRAALAAVAARLGGHAVRGPQVEDARGHRAVAAARAYLEARATTKVTLADLARASEVSPYHLVRVFSAELGVPPHAYQLGLRVRIARGLLEAGATAARAASEAGFCDQAHLSRVFKSYTGVTPGQFARATRRANRGAP
ncbi:AraC-like DNA-binding protein [Actinokineospora auranticolor]|uniref:AraC-like DNA-binding protein n=1 Tax=Actinokineospora auranticolor TaxID=155976 RepID=A0A2S6GI18_9PSEU|nr:AraC-like DNA-binding protein [Actinokineospora auranticolor]